jgi:CHAT domain/Cytosol aminopeptidase family, N-terminal domain
VQCRWSENIGAGPIGRAMRVMSDTQQREWQDDKIGLSVVHGHLAFARFPVLVGHYRGDTFAGTEARLDRALGSRLSERRKMGLYPGRIGTTTVLLDPNSKPSGAVVVGLGEPAGLSVGALRETLRQGILAFVAAKLDQGCAGPDAADPKTRLGLSSLLVGAGEGGIDRNSCVQALLQATSQTDAMLAGLKLPHVRLDSIEIIELYEDRAYETWRAAKKAVDSDTVLSSGFKLAPEVKPCGGGRRHAPIGRDPNWWQPIQISMPRVDGPEDRSLSFTIGGGFARAEARTIGANLDIVAPLLRRTFRNIDLDGSATSPGRILFELLWPESLKHQSADERNRRLILDEQSAAFPWELLDDRRPWISGEGESASSLEPPAVRAGTVRQLLQARSLEKVTAARGAPKALIIGDPNAQPMEGFPKLPGAEAEARSIARLLGDARRTHDVTMLVNGAATPEQIYKQLLAQAWEIVHISAHGVVDYELTGSDGIKRRVTGIVLGGGIVLGPSALSKLPVSPSIFFVNCCNLGKIDAAVEDKARQESLEGRPEFAASVAVELIRLGVRCVIVAGWEVDDDGAQAFGERFYSEMLSGETFGDATLRARQAAYKAKPNSNTWGAYQCYGEPDYRLRVAPANSPAKENGNQFVAIAEAIAAAEQIRADVNIGLERDLEVQRSRIVRIEEEAGRRDWLGSALLRVALAEARAELGDVPAAIDHYSAALVSNEAAFKVKAVEQLANLRARDTVREFRKAPAEGRNQAQTIETIKTSLRMLQSLTEAVGPTPERLSLQGSCWKRLAQVQASWPAADEALCRMVDCCDQAAELGGTDPGYPRLMACNARACIAVRSGTDCDEAVDQILRRLTASPPPDEADFWRLIRWADAQTNVAIMQASTPSSEDTDNIREAYRRTWRHVGSPVKMRSVTEQLEFYEDIFADGAPKTAPRRKGVVEWIAELRNFVETEFPGVKPG